MANRFNFRAYILKEKYMVDVEILHPEYILAYDGKTYSLNNVNNSKNYILMQSTGLTDKNGKKIFEGDIIQGEYEGKQFIFEVIWKKTGFCLRTGITTMSFANIENIEVIGNIYENEQLIKE